ncbi:L,D-transpeptidase family protein [Kaistia terrae]|uniref:Transcriptional regulator n=1 Tax=Kaistia terrae TaxID=537017 RepID=A0ABW0Q5Z0_9HYPH|nr:murein L,D-transpeptidase family protein [Kaistia terrae]MCX5581252.1 murein L,D-transpeptidase [Kaistia terrae]
MPGSAFFSRLRNFVLGKFGLNKSGLGKAVLLLAVGLVLAACQDGGVPKHMKPLPAKLKAKMEQLNMDAKAPIYIRSFKETSEFEVWKQRRDGSYGLLKTYAICKWSGKLGPKIKEGDRQAPEGFYTVKPGQMNPNSQYYLSFNIGFPNAYDDAWGRTGNSLMVHGACSSAGCYSMTDESAGEIYWLARDSFIGGQRSFEVHLYPFRMTAENMAKHRNDPNMPFWKMLKDGNDHFEVTRKPPVVGVCGKSYVFNVDTGGAKLNAAAACPANMRVPEWLDAAVKQKQSKDQQIFLATAAKLDGQDQVAASKAVTDAAARQASLEAEAVASAPAAFTPVAAAEPMGNAASMAIDGVPAPEMPLPVPSPVRMTADPAADVYAPAPVEKKPGFWDKFKKRQPS